MKISCAVLAAFVMSLATVTAHCDEPLFEQTDVFVAGEDGICEYRIPALVTSVKGTLIAVCDGRVSKPGDAPNNIDLMLKRSTDGGKNMVAGEATSSITPAARRRPIRVFWSIETNGRIWAFYAHAPEGIGSRQSKPGLSGPTFRYEAVASDDDGLTWSKPARPEPHGEDSRVERILAGSGAGDADARRTSAGSVEPVAANAESEQRQFSRP